MDEQLRLYSLLIDQIQKYNSIVWQIPTALLVADVLALQQLEARPVALVGVAVVSSALTFAYYRMAVAQGTIIDAARNAEAVLRKEHAGFVPTFIPTRLSARWAMVVALAIFNVGFSVFAVAQACGRSGRGGAPEEMGVNAFPEWDGPSIIGRVRAQSSRRTVHTWFGLSSMPTAAYRASGSTPSHPSGVACARPRRVSRVCRPPTYPETNVGRRPPSHSLQERSL